MKPIKIDIGSNVDFSAAQTRASREVPLREEQLTLVGWYDRQHRTGGPLEACGGQPLKTAVDYARANGAEYQVSGGKRFEFFYSEVPDGTAQLDPEMLVEIHRGLEHNSYENVQGG